VSSANSFTITCNWKPSLKSTVTISATFVPTSNAYSVSTQKISAFVFKRNTLR
jgi:hypothetical protein